MEIKSGATITSEQFKNLHFWQNLTGEEKCLLVYGGDDQQSRSPGIDIKSWRMLPEL